MIKGWHLDSSLSFLRFSSGFTGSDHVREFRFIERGDGVLKSLLAVCRRTSDFQEFSDRTATVKNIQLSAN